MCFLFFVSLYFECSILEGRSMTGFEKNNQFYLTTRRTPLGFYRIVLVWNGRDFVRKGVLTEDEAFEFVQSAKRQGVPYVPEKTLKV